MVWVVSPCVSVVDEFEDFRNSALRAIQNFSCCDVLNQNVVVIDGFKIYAYMSDMEVADSPEPGYLLLRVHVPELNIQKCLQFPSHQLVWDVKQQCLAALPKVVSWFTVPDIALFLCLK
nr:uncharacterized protein LOC112211532 [Halyomorpha halys]